MFSAIRLAHRTRRTGVKITLVNPSSRFVERLRMHQIATGQKLADHRIPDLLAGTGVTFVQGTATAIGPEARRITVDNAETLGYDTLVYALGSSTDTGKVPGADTQAFTLNHPQIAGRFAARLTEVAAWSDGGGKVTAARRPLNGTDHVARWLVGFLAKPDLTTLTMEPAVINGELGILATLGGHTVGALTFDLADHRIQNLRFQVNPEKLSGLTPPQQLGTALKRSVQKHCRRTLEGDSSSPGTGPARVKRDPAGRHRCSRALRCRCPWALPRQRRQRGIRLHRPGRCGEQPRSLRIRTPAG
ncbi:FAD-dependent oxidoreductase [Streptomyces sp. NPDC093094]|uniref:FAD-dependent oxidoreductase n=1 Tax=Streptomyces sp. NPDC093094 TaxID=3366026 RepID=UPI0037F29631